MTKRALICGVSGQDGAYLAKLLIEKGYSVTGTSRDAQASSFDRLKRLGVADDIKLVSMQPTDFRSVLNVVAAAAPHEIYNLSGQTSVGLSFQQPVESLESNSIATLNLLEVIRFVDPKIRFYNAGSSECFGDTKGTPANEETPFYPRSPYAVAKASAFWITANYREAYNLHASNGILFNHESPLRPARFVTQKIVAGACAIKNGMADRLELGNLEVARDWGYAPEYVDAMWRIQVHDEPVDLVIASGETYSLKQFVDMVFQACDLDWQDYVRVNDELRRPSDISYNGGDPSKAAKTINWAAKTRLPELVKIMVDAEQNKAVR